MMHGYTHNSDDKAQLINDNLDIVKKIAFFYVGRVGKVVEVDDNCTEQFTAKEVCLLYTSPSPRDGLLSRMPSSA